MLSAFQECSEKYICSCDLMFIKSFAKERKKRSHKKSFGQSLVAKAQNLNAKTEFTG